MALTIDLPSDLQQRLKAAAEQRGQSIHDYLRGQLERLLPPAPPSETRDERGTRVLTGAGKFAHVPFSSDDLCRERYEEGLRELERDRRLAAPGTHQPPDDQQP
jgi:Antitoxin ParD